MFKGSDSVGSVAPGLPNITGSIQTTNYDLVVINQASTRAEGAIYFEDGKGMYNDIKDGNTGAYPLLLGFNANLSNKIYGNSCTVQSPAITLISQIKF